VVSNRIIFVAASVFLSTGAPALAASANDLLPSCEALIRNLGAEQDGRVHLAADGVPCWHYFLAIQDLSKLAEPDIQHPILGICAPPTSRLTQIIRIFVQYAERNPAMLHEPAASVGLIALRGAFPCP
jgi:hypothetical protein